MTLRPEDGTAALVLMAERRGTDEIAAANIASGRSAGASLLATDILLPFLLVALIWGSTWIVIRDQLGDVPATWSVTYRFTIASAAMFIAARAGGAGVELPGQGHLVAAALGLLQFVVSFNSIYSAESHITSGLVAVTFALLVIPNSALGRLVLGQTLTSRFVLGSSLALAGIGMLFLQELQASRSPVTDVTAGIAFALLAILAASLANLVQTLPRAAAYPIATVLAWAMFYGSTANLLIALVVHGPPVITPRTGYWAGLLYLSVFGSAVTFALQFKLLRTIGPGRTAYISLLVPIIAMWLSSLFEGFIWSEHALAGAALALVGLTLVFHDSHRFRR